MPTINIPPKVRFALYVVGALASLGVVYAVDKAWAGDAEVRFVQGLVALLNVLAAANVSSPRNSPRILGKAVAPDLRKLNDKNGI